MEFLIEVIKSLAIVAFIIVILGFYDPMRSIRYTIIKHRSMPFRLPKWNFDKSMTYVVQFEQVAYQSSSIQMLNAANKLFGFSLDASHHHANSLRVVWRYREKNDVDYVQLGISYYCNGFRKIVFSDEDDMIDLSLNKRNRIELAAYSDDCLVLVDGKIICTMMLERKHKFIGYKLRPYFGGNDPVPEGNAISIRLINM